MSLTSLPCFLTAQAPPLPSPRRIVLALLAGALCGAGFMAGLGLLTGLVQGAPTYGLLLAALILPFGFIGWLAGLVVIGGPAWWLARKAKASPTRLAAGIGAVLTPLFLAAPMVVGDLVHGDIAPGQILMVAAYAVLGAIVGWVVARIAYGRAR